MLPPRPLLFVIIALASQLALAEGTGEFSEPTPEEIDAAFNAEDAAREAAGWSAAPPAAVATDTLAALVAAADTVVRGRVTGQSVVYDEQDVPSTLTTLSIEQVLKGDPATAEITLGQEGGPARNDKDLFMLVSTSHHFYPGEEELLFLKRGSGAVSAGSNLLVQERFRLYEGRVYDEDGRGVLLEDAGPGKGQRLRRSDDRHPHLRFRQIHIGRHTLLKNFSGPDGVVDTARQDTASGGRASPPMGRRYSDSVEADVFGAAITQRKES